MKVIFSKVIDFRLYLLAAHISEAKNDKICLLIKNGGRGEEKL